MKKVKLTKIPPSEAKLKAGDWMPIEKASEMDTLTANGFEYITEDEDKLIRAREVTIDNAIKSNKAFAPKQDTSEIKAKALKFEAVEDGLGVTFIQSHKAEERDEKLSARQTSADASQFITAKGFGMGDAGIKETVRGFLQASESDHKLMRNGGVVRATNKDVKGIEEAVADSKKKAIITASLMSMISAGGDFKLTEDIITAAYDGYADPAGALGVLNTAITLQWNLGHLENQLILLDDIVMDVSGTPVLFNQQARSRYIKVPGVQLKTAATAWSGTTGNDVDVNILMNNYAGVPISLNNITIASTARQLMNEQKSPQLYGLAEYILYTVINTAINGSTRFNNDGVTTATIKAASAFVDPQRGVGAFDVAGATLATFVGSLPAAMDLSKFPGGDEAPGATDLMRYAWAHTSLYSSIASDTNYMLNQTLQGISQDRSQNLTQTGRFLNIGNNKFRKSQLVLDNNTTSGTGADGGANAMFVVPGAYATAKTVGIAGTRNGLMFVNRAPLDYTKIMPEIPSTAAIELVSTPKLGITFVIVKYLDHAFEVANMRAQTMWGNAIGDERQLMLLKQAS